MPTGVPIRVDCPGIVSEMSIDIYIYIYIYIYKECVFRDLSIDTENEFVTYTLYPAHSLFTCK